MLWHTRIQPTTTADYITGHNGRLDLRRPRRAERKVACEILPFSFRNKLYLHMKAIEGRVAFPKRFARCENCGHLGVLNNTVGSYFHHKQYLKGVYITYAV